MGDYMVRLRETGSMRHRLLGRDSLVNRWFHAVSFETVESAEEAAQWMLDNNASSLDSGQVVEAFGRRRIVRRLEATHA